MIMRLKKLSYHLYGWNVDEYCEGFEECKTTLLIFLQKFQNNGKGPLKSILETRL
jgi:hypothetical protein